MEQTEERVRIRNATVDDLNGIVKVLINSWRHGYQSFVPSEFLDELDFDRQFKRHKQYLQHNTTYWVATDGDKKILGFASFGSSRISEYRAAAEIYALYVSPKFQAVGIGTRLLNKVIEAIEKSQRIVVSVFRDNPYKSFYSKHGFKKVSEEKIELSNDVWLASEILILP